MAALAREPASSASGSLAEPIEPIEAEVYSALILGLSDYVNKNGFEQVVLGVSGGIDSALVACLAVRAACARQPVLAPGAAPSAADKPTLSVPPPSVMTPQGY